MKEDKNLRKNLYLKFPIIISDMLIMSAILFILFKFLPENQLAGITDNISGILSLLMVSYCFCASILKIKLYKRSISITRVAARAILGTVFTYALFTALLTMCYKSVPRHLIMYGLLITSVALAGWHILANRVIRNLRFNTSHKLNVIFVGADEPSQRLSHELTYNQRFIDYHVLGFFSSAKDLALPEGEILLGGIEDVFKWLECNHPDEIYCSLPPKTNKNIVNRLIRHCNQEFIDFFFVPTMDGYPDRTMVISRIGKTNVIKLREEPMGGLAGNIYRRIFSFVFSLILLCTIYPFIFLFAAIGIKISSPGPIYFKQKRTGYNGKSFEIYKFRSMRVNNQADTLQATEDDPRKTRFGDFLRRSSIDEMPQFINVLLGDMNIVGPRPHMEHHTEVYSQLIGNYMLRHLAKPGITGWAQITGYRGETQTTEQMAERVKRDIWYIEHWSPLLDIEIILKTILQVLKGDDERAY